MSQGPPKIFDERLSAVRQDRAARRTSKRGESFLLRRMVDDLADRLGDVNRRFARALLVAPHGADAMVRGSVAADRVPDELVVRAPSEHTQLGLGLGLEAESFDLAVALVGPGQVNDLPGSLIEMRRALRPDGLLIAGWLGGETLHELRDALYSDDQARRGGLSPRVHPTVDHTQAAALLGRAGLALPVVDKDRFTVRYSKLQTLVNDLRDLGVTNALEARDRGWLGRGALERIAEHYRMEGEKFPATFEVVWITGWAPDASQPKPLAPGSAKMRLADALGVEEGKV